jgi:cell division initiation protein
MKITPIEIQQQEFKRSFLGLEPREVRHFLELVRDTVEELSRENTALAENQRHLESELQRHRERERVLQDTLLSAQRLSEEMKSNAHKEAEIVIAQAELEGEKIVQNAHQRLLKLFEEIHELRRQKVQFESGLRRLLEQHQKLLEIASAGEHQLAEIESNVQELKPRAGALPPALPTAVPRAVG